VLCVCLCLIVCGPETSTTRPPRPKLGCNHKRNKSKLHGTLRPLSWVCSVTSKFNLLERCGHHVYQLSVVTMCTNCLWSPCVPTVWMSACRLQRSFMRLIIFSVKQSLIDWRYQREMWVSAVSVCCVCLLWVCCEYLLGVSAVSVCCECLLWVSAVSICCECLLWVCCECLLWVSAMSFCLSVCCERLLWVSGMSVCCECLLWVSAMSVCCECLLWASVVCVCYECAVSAGSVCCECLLWVSAMSVCCECAVSLLWVFALSVCYDCLLWVSAMSVCSECLLWGRFKNIFYENHAWKSLKYLKSPHCGLQQFVAPRMSKEVLHEGGKVVSPTYRPPLPHKKHAWCWFLLEARSTLGP
jgi:hypothetical protein